MDQLFLAKIDLKNLI